MESAQGYCTVTDPVQKGCVDGPGSEVPTLRDLEQLLLGPEVQRSADARGV